MDATTKPGLFFENDQQYNDHPDCQHEDGLQYLKEDHSHLRTLYKRYNEAEDVPTKVGLAERIIKNISTHASAEERYFYPQAKKLPGGQALYERALMDDQIIKDTMYYLESNKPSKDLNIPEWQVFDATVKKLIHISTEHIDIEETMYIAALKDVLSPDEKQELMRNMQSGKKTAFTHPHPEGPAADSIVTRVAHPVVAAVDRVIDAAKGSRRLQVLSGHLTAAGGSDGGSTCPRSLDRQHTSAGSYDPAQLLKSQVAIITGAGQGVGAAAARLFAQHGASVVVSDIDAKKADQVTQDICRSGGRAIAVAGDVTAADFPERVVKQAVAAFGGVDILVNNAGYTWDAVIHKITPKQWEAMLAVHCTAPFRLIQAAAPYMRDAAKKEMEAGGSAKPRCILNVSSTSGTHGNFGQANYSTAKAGVIGLTKTVAKEWGMFNIRCNALTYGFINTRLVQPKEAGAQMVVNGEKVALGIPGGGNNQEIAKAMLPLQRVGTAEEAAGAMLMLASPYASYITAQALEVTGGGWA
ncbi:hypothetical protein WJX72_005721 [[Myrmecia] bisecta]|uniref:Hemerythrin-like domain-containing protein n=1 Tax=[Myrmecia] bisecta TaxID=41462 RepID=A0AAW1PRX7_9CHLO